VLAPRDGSLTAVLLATQHPERISHLVFINGFARTLRAPDYEFGAPDRLIESFLDSNTDPAQHPADSPTDPFLVQAAPSLAADPEFRRWWERSGRQGASPATARAVLTMDLQADVRPLLGRIRAPALVLQCRDAIVYRAEHGRYLAEHIPGARYVELPGADTLFWAGETTEMLDEIEQFLTGARRGPPTDRVLATVLFTDIVRSTESLAGMGDRSWRELLDRHDAMVGRQIDRFGGRRVKSTGDGALAVFDGPARAVLCACAVRDGAVPLGIEIRSGVHTGEIEVRGDDIAGMAVHIAARIESLASAGEVIVSRTVVELVVGSGIAFEERGIHELKGVPGTWPLFAVAG
jgi:class 3 adenylate cyclase